MSNSFRSRVIVLTWRKVFAALPALGLIGAGLALTVVAAPANAILQVTVPSSSSAILVPDIAMTMPAVPALTRASHFPQPEDGPGLPPPVGGPLGGSAPALVLPVGTLPGSTTPVALDSNGVPIRALEAYRAAASLIGSADQACHIDWALLAAIGRVESNHARFGGNQLDSAGVAQPGIIGIALDGTNGTARITDTDGGRLDRDTVYDRAVGPMQFIPSTWRVAGADGNHDGVKNPQNMADAATATAIYLCSGPGDLRLAGDLHAAIMRYNASDSYVRTVTAIADAYRHGVSALPASDLPAANSAPSRTAVASAFTPNVQTPATHAPATPAVTTPVSLPTAPVAPAPVPTTPVPTAPVAPAPVPTAIPGSRDHTALVPPAPVAALPDPCMLTAVPPEATVPNPTPTITVPNPAPTGTTIPDPTPTLPDRGLPTPCLTPPLAQETCTITPPQAKICTIVPLGPVPTTTR